MAKKRFDEQMQAFGQWKTDLLKGIQFYQKWLEVNKMSNAEDELRIYEILDALKSDKLTIAFVAEFARGKTELINAIFFSEYDRRLLPSEAGRTTMCPTELLFDQDAPSAYIRLLPIETRLTEVSIAEYKSEPIHWTSMELDLDHPESMAESFKEIVKVKKVPVDDARKLGLFNDNDRHMLNPDGSVPSEVEVPMWRHALISFPHPLLKQGLVILDTPGLNALGSEPELTLNMLPNAQAVLFIMAADTGVTKSDMDMWNMNVKPLREGRDKGLVVVLNKIDTLWDELKKREDIDRTISEQCRKAAQILGIDTHMVFPASAQKGLLGKIRHDSEMMQRSNILKLEEILATEVLPQKQQLLRAHVIAEIGNLIKGSHDLLASRLKSSRDQLQELKGLGNKNEEMITHLMQKTREEQVAYHKNVESFQANKKLLSEQSHKLMDLLSLPELDKLVSETRKVMSDSWTTPGLKKGMKTFFDGIAEKFAAVNDYTEQMNRLVQTVYRKFHEEHGIAEIKPVLYDPTPYTRELDKLAEEAEAFRNSPVTTMTEQSFVIKKFFITLVSHARNIFFKAHREAENWSKAVLTPLVRQIKEHKEQMEKRLDNLRKINESRDTLNGRIEELQKVVALAEKQYREISAIMRLINKPLPGSQEEAAAPEAKKATA